MSQLTPEGQRIVGEVASRHGFSFDAVATLLQAVAAGGGTQAQFNHWEFGGMGQWSLGGMIMIGDMFNNQLKYRVESLCNELSNILANSTVYAPPPQPQFQSSQSQSQGGGTSYQAQGSGGFQQSGSSLFVPGPGSANWWPQDLGIPSSTGAQNNLRYAVFPDSRRLAIDINGAVTVYDIGDHMISGFSQQQSGDQSLTFTSQSGTVYVSQLPIISPSNQQQPIQDQNQAPPPAPEPAPAPVEQQPPEQQQQPMPYDTMVPNTTADKSDVFATLERLADLRQKGIISDSEFESKKAELLSRI